MAKGLQLIRVAGQRPGDDFRQVLVLPAVLGAAKKVLQKWWDKNERLGPKNEACSTFSNFEQPETDFQNLNEATLVERPRNCDFIPTDNLSVFNS